MVRPEKPVRYIFKGPARPNRKKPSPNPTLGCRSFGSIAINQMFNTFIVALYTLIEPLDITFDTWHL